ncbi:FAD binding domain-containing protein [Gracilimonas sp.]|uniref:FAD binding domain-containing protein n=1 Tax=Gracilimonas sp. TaxID=1974203 RepID=UPI0032EE441B
MEQPKGIIIGGSLSGLFLGTLLKNIGWEIEIYERSEHDLDSRGGGIVLQPDILQLFQRVGIKLGFDLGVDSKDRIVFNPDGSVRSLKHIPQTQTSWSLIYSRIKKAFGEENYFKGKRLIDLKQDQDSVQAFFEDGTMKTGHFLFGCDGFQSTVREIVNPDVKPLYSGYIAWRGLIREKELPEVAQKWLVGQFGFANNKHSHVLGYLVPGDNNNVSKGSRYYNWVWYRVVDEHDQLPSIMTDKNNYQRKFSLPEGSMKDEWKQHINEEADLLLPPQFSETIKATQEPFAQAIVDVTVSKMVYNRVILVGDAAFTPRPHTAASTAKAAINALLLENSLVENSGDISSAIKAWESSQVIYGHRLHKQGVQTGNYLLYNR